jgi:hypothetical protein
MQCIVDNSMSQIISNAQVASNDSNYASGAEIYIFDSFILSPVFHHTSWNDALKPGTSNRDKKSCLDETDRRALERAENEGMI